MWCRPERSSVSPMYMPGRFRTASRPFRSLIESVLYAVLLIGLRSSRHGAQRTGRRCVTGPHLENRGDPAAEPRGRRGARQENRGTFGKTLEKLHGPALGQAGVEIVRREQGSLPSKTLDGAPLGELGKRDRAGDLARGRLRGQRRTA